MSQIAVESPSMSGKVQCPVAREDCPVLAATVPPETHARRAFVLKYVQPALVGMIDGTVSTLAPVFAAALLSGPHAAFMVGMATTLGAGVSMGWSEALSDNGEQTGRGRAVVRGAVTGTATAVGGVFHTLPFLIPHLGVSLVVAFAVVFTELLVISWVRHHWMNVRMSRSLVSVGMGGLIVLGIGLALGAS